MNMKFYLLFTIIYLHLCLSLCERAIQIYEELQQKLSEECKAIDKENDGDRKACGATADFSLLCLPSGNIGDVYRIHCKIEIPGTNDTIENSMVRTCSSDGEWVAMDRCNRCKAKSIAMLYEEFFQRGINPFDDLDHYDLDEVIQKLGRFEEEEQEDVNNSVIFSTEDDGNITEEDSKGLKLLTFILGIISCLFAVVGLGILMWLNPKKKNDRINIHRHLFAALSLMYITEIIFFQYGAKINLASSATCHTSYFLWAYFAVLVHAWLLNEGIYHFWIIFFPYKDELKFRWFIIIGYGIPTILLGIHIPGVLLAEGEYFLCKRKSLTLFPVSTIWDKLLWYSSSSLLFINILIFIYLMVILKKKLQREKGSNLRKSWRLTRSWMILLILLGGGQFFGFDTTLEKKYIGLNYFQRTVLGLQGFLVFLSQVVFSSDVRSKIYNKWRIHQQKQEMMSTPMSTRAASSSMKLSLTKLNSFSNIGTLTHIGGSRKTYVVNSLKRKQENDEESPTGIYIGKRNSLAVQQVFGTALKVPVNDKQPLGFDNIGFHKDEDTL